MVKQLYLALGVMLGAVNSNAQYIDSSFGVYGIVNTSFVAATPERCSSIVIQPDSKILAGGNSKSSATLEQFVLARYDTTGALDNTFGTGGKVIIPNAGISNQLKEVAVQPDGKILAVGIAQTAPFSPWTTMLVRYNANGTPDLGFGTNGIVTTAVGTKADAYSVLVQPDKKILICGTQYDDNYYILVRYNANGTLDNGFGTGGVVQFGQFGTGMAIALQPDGKILVSGEFWGTVILNGPNSGVARHNIDGSVDNTFGNNGVSYIIAPGAGDNMWGGHDLKVLPNGKILVSVFYNSPSIAQKPAVVRLTSTGQRDMSFGNNSYATTTHGSFNAKCEEMSIQPDGKILLIGNIATSAATQKDSFFVSRFDTSGAPDNTFGIAGRITASLGPDGSNAASIALQSNGRFILGGMQGTTAAKKFSLFRYRYAPSPVINNIEKVPGKVSDFSVFPNPASDKIHILMIKAQSACVTISDMNGRTIMSKEISAANAVMDVKELIPGNYIISVTSEGISGYQLFNKN